MWWALFLFLVTSPAQASKAVDCANSCSLEKRDDGSLHIACQCGKKPQKPWSSKSRAIFYSSQLTGATEAEAEAIKANACKNAKPIGSDLKRLFTLANRPLCECVATRLYFGLEKECKRTAAGSVTCQLHYKPEPSTRPRSPSLFDYESCVEARANYRKPASCEDVTCEKKKPECKKGEEWVNLADPEACCPVFVCHNRKKSI